ncbi:acyl-CoA transferase [Roseococcus sp. SYP-B2431]|uniref:CoA transferase n=1 Tax=Roseococcus sp. SYP-B2431 TaxID=2496640 RepID=UPI00103F16E7|nr:CoA transferase [Roseococcus sp. SYP-B2431]TCH96330.1 acyl-CoA transferase [Roseococcus sp. SYP-B2431]
MDQATHDHAGTEAVFLQDIWTGIGGDAAHLARARFTGEGGLTSAFAATPIAAASVAAAGLAAAELAAARIGAMPEVAVDRRLASFWFGWSIRPQGWKMPETWDVVAGDYATRDGWIKLHTNAPHHRAAALAVLGAPPEKAAVARAVATWSAEELEAAIVAAGGCAASMRSLAAWAEHPQGSAVAQEPPLWIETTGAATQRDWPFDPARPLAGLRVLDMTRVLAGPVATRFLALLGAEVLRIDPPGWEEPGIVPEISLGKRCARLDLRSPEGKDRLAELFRGADIFLNGYRPDALERLGFGTGARHALRPGLVDVRLDAYGWTGPWAGRRGFDSLVQMSSGIADEGMRRAGAGKPTPLPVQALDHATGYILAAAAMRGLTRRVTEGLGSASRTSLARTAALLVSRPAPEEGPLAPVGEADLSEAIEETSWGPARRVRPPLEIAGVRIGTEIPARKLGGSEPRWTA